MIEGVSKRASCAGGKLATERKVGKFMAKMFADKVTNGIRDTTTTSGRWYQLWSRREPLSGVVIVSGWVVGAVTAFPLAGVAVIRNP